MKITVLWVLFFLPYVSMGLANNHAESALNTLHEEGIEVQVQKGMSLNQVANLLKQQGVIKNIFYFKLLAYIQGKSEKIQSGEYVFQTKLSSQEVLDILVQGKTRLYRVTFPEGYNFYEMANLLDQGQFLKKADFISLCQNPQFVYEMLGEKRLDLEGYLFPDTYYIPKPVQAKVLIQQMVQNFFKTYAHLSLTASTSKAERLKGPGLPSKLTRHEQVILASIVEKETGLAKERTLIASVFYNRLKKGQRLESDPTILYGMMREKGGLIELNIRKKDILRKTPYNTYRIPRFPVGPIGNPGAGALKAVLKPATSSFFYFVSKNDGSHVFSKTYKEHKKAVDYYQKKRHLSRKP